MNALALAAMLAVAGAAAPATPSTAQGDVVAIVQMPRTIGSGVFVVDPMFGQQVRALGLERSVRMWQWQRRSDGRAGYEAVWSARLLGNQGVDAAHANPARFPIDGARWWSSDARLETHSVGTDVLTAVAAQADAKNAWIAVKPDMARLPVNLAATFQPDGDGLSTSQNPAHRQVGDVQVQWRALIAAPAPAGLVLADGSWRMPAVAPVAPAAASGAPASAVSSGVPAQPSGKPWPAGKIGLLALLGVALLAFGLTMRRKR